VPKTTGCFMKKHFSKLLKIYHVLRSSFLQTSNKNILFISSSLDNTGAEKLLVEYINHIASRYAVVLICNKRGILIKNLDKSVKVFVVNYSASKTIFQKIMRRVKIHLLLPYLFSKYKKYYWYINTIVLPIPVKYAANHNIKFALHVHELKHMYSYLSNKELNLALNAPDLLLANSRITKQNLASAGAPSNTIQITTPFIDYNRLKAIEPCLPKTLIKNEYCWVMAGSIDKNKNPQLFLDIATEAYHKNLNYKFVWLYNVITDNDLLNKLNKQIAYQNLPLTFIKTKNYNEYLSHLNSADGLLLTSEFESFSIVTLEALAFGLCIVANDCGGINEIVNKNTASVITEKNNLDAFIHAMKNEIERKDSISDQKKQVARSFDKQQILKNWEELISKMMSHD
jgi:glycosyltransferase involved in cell wall biosynthesis